MSFPVHLVIGGDRIAHAATGLLISYVILAGDKLLGTDPDQSEVPKSGTARTLGVDVP